MSSSAFPRFFTTLVRTFNRAQRSSSNRSLSHMSGAPVRRVAVAGGGGRRRGVLLAILAGLICGLVVFASQKYSKDCDSGNTKRWLAEEHFRASSEEYKQAAEKEKETYQKQITILKQYADKLKLDLSATKNEVERLNKRVATDRHALWQGDPEKDRHDPEFSSMLHRTGKDREIIVAIANSNGNSLALLE